MTDQERFLLATLEERDAEIVRLRATLDAARRKDEPGLRLSVLEAVDALAVHYPDPSATRDRVLAALAGQADAETGGLRGKPWLVRLVCCGTADGYFAADTWEEADAFRQSYTTGPGTASHSVTPNGHDRRAVIEDGLAGRAALATPPTDAGLDVDRLARAMWAYHGRPDDWDANIEHYRSDAYFIAREYGAER